MADNKVQIVIEVDAAKGTANIRNLQESFGSLQGRAAALGTEYDRVRASARKTSEAKQQLTSDIRQATAATDRFRSSMDAVQSILLKVGAAAAAVKATRASFDYLSRIETAQLGISAAYMTSGQYIDAVTSKALAGQEALRAAQHDARKMVEELQYANLQTIATLDELVNAYQVTLPVAMARGFNREQIKDFTVAMVQAAGAIGLPMNQLSEETRSILTGAIDPRTSRIATILGLRNEDIAEYKGNAKALFDFLMQKLDAYKVAGIEAQTTWAGLWSNTKDIVLKALGDGFEPLFTTVKYELQRIGAEMVTLDETTKQIKWNDSFVSGVTTVKEGITATIAEAYRLGMLLDKAGGSMTRLAHGLTLSELTGYEGFARANETFLENYRRSEKAVQDLAMRQQGWFAMTPEMDRQIREAVMQGKKIADQTWVNIGGPGDGTAQLLRYYKPVEQKASYKQEEEANRAFQEAYKKGLAELHKKWQEEEKKLLEQWDKEKDLIGQTATEKELAQLQRQYDAYNRVVQDKVALEQWWASEKAAIDARAANETIALYEELYKATARQDYANAAIDAMKTVLDSQEKTWARMLGSEQDARLLRLKREDDYAAKVKALLGDIVEATVEAEQARTEAVAAGVDARIDAENAYAAAVPASRSAPAAGATYDVVYNRVFINARDEALRFQEEVLSAFQAAEKQEQKAQEEALRLAEEQARMAQQQAEAIARAVKEAEDLAEAVARIDFKAIANAGRLSNFGGFGAAVSSALSALGLGQAEKGFRLAELDAFFSIPANYAAYNAESVLDKYLEYLSLTFDTYAAEIDAREDLLSILSREQDFRARMLLSDLSPVSSAEAFTARYEALLAAAGNSSGDYEAFTSFLEQEYLPYMKAYTGGDQSYREIWDSLFGAGGVLEGISAPIASGASASLEDLQAEGLDRLAELASMVDKGGPLYGLLSDAAQAQAEYGNAFLTAMSNSLTEMQAQGTNLKNIDAYTLGTQANTVLLQNLVKYIGKTEAYEVGGAYYNAAQVDLLAQNAQATGSYFQLAPGGSYYQSVPSSWTKATLTPNPATGEFSEPIVSPVAGLSVPAYYSSATGKYYGKGIVDSMLANSLTLWSNVLGYVDGDFTPDLDARIYGALTSAYARQDQLVTPQVVDMAWVTGDRVSGAGADFLEYPANSGQWVRRWSHDTPRSAGNGKAILFGAGGLTSGLSIAGERGPEWVVPTYEPERSRFLASVPSEFWRDVLPSAPATRSLAAPSIDPEAIGRAVARAILAAGIEGDREIHIHLEVDGREISRAVADGFRRGDADLVTQARRRMAS